MREAHQKALAMVATLKEEIERLSCPLTWSWPEVRAQSKSRDWWACGVMGQKRRYHHVWPEHHPAPYHPSRKDSVSGKEPAATEDLDLEEPLELGPEVACFLRGSTENSKEEDKKVPQAPTQGVSQVGAMEGRSMQNA